MYYFFGLLALCVTAMAIVGMVLGFCYKQEKNISLRGNAKADKEGFNSELALDIETNKKRGKKEFSK